MKDISFILTQLNVGGAETQVALLARSFAKRGWKVRVISLRKPKAWVEVLERDGISVCSLDLERKMPSVKKLVNIVRILSNCKIVHSHQVHSNIFARLMRPVFKFPVLICTAHNIYEGPKWRDIAYKMTDFLCDLTTNVSRVAVQRYIKDNLASCNKIIYIPNAINKPFFSEESINSNDLENIRGAKDEFVWLAVGRLVPAKDYLNLIESFAIAHNRCRNSRLLIAGDGEERSKIESLISDKGIQSHVKLLGNRDDVLYLMKSADAYVMSSAWEGLPMVLLEASIAGLPIVTTNVGGNNEIVINGETGFIVESRDPNLLSDAMVKMMELGYEKRQNLGRLGRAHVETNYSTQKIINRWETIYKELASRKGLEL